MNCEMEQVGGALVVKLRGEIDQHCAEELRGDIDRQLDIKHSASLIIDLGGVDFMDSSGLGLIMGRYRKMQARGGKILLARPTPAVDRLLELSGINKLVGRERTK